MSADANVMSCELIGMLDNLWSGDVPQRRAAEVCCLLGLMDGSRCRVIPAMLVRQQAVRTAQRGREQRR